jgi:hypothetical protein
LPAGMAFLAADFDLMFLGHGATHSSQVKRFVALSRGRIILFFTR